MKMTGNMVTLSILILLIPAFATIPGNAALTSAQDYMQEIRALEHRVSMLEKAMKDLTKLVAKDAEATMDLYQEIEEAIRGSDSRIDSLERKISAVEKIYADE